MAEIESFYWFPRSFEKSKQPRNHGCSSLGLGDEGRSGSGLVLPGRGKDLALLVVASEAVDAALDENQAELGVDVGAVALKVAADVHGLLDEVVEVLRKGGGNLLGAKDTEDLLAGDGSDLGDTHGIPEVNTDLGGGVALLGHLHDLFLNLKNQIDIRLQFQDTTQGKPIKS